MLINSGKKLSLVYFVTVILAACSLLYELLVAQTVSFFAADRVVWYSLTVGVFLGAMGAGAFLQEKLCKNKDLLVSLVKVEVLLSLFGGASVIFINYIHMLFAFCALRGALYLGIGVFFLTYFLLTITIGFLSGLELPIIIKVGNSLSASGNITNRILSADYFGSLVSGIIFPVILIPNFELIQISFMIAGINLIVAILILFYLIRKGREIVFTASGILALLAVIVFCLIYSKGIQQYFLQKYYYYEESSRDIATLIGPTKGLPTVERIKSPYQTIDLHKIVDYKDSLSSKVVEAYSNRYKENTPFYRDYLLSINGNLQDWLDFEESYHESFAHVPIILNNKVPRNVLVLGAGDGFLLKELVKYKGIESITLVEIDKEMIRLAKESLLLTEVNGNAFADKRVNVVIADAYQYMRNSNSRYDAIYTDFPIAHDYNLNKLYTREFYYYLNRALNDDGFVASNSVELATSLKNSESFFAGKFVPENIWDIYYSTLSSAGFKYIIPFSNKLDITQRAKDVLNYEIFKNEKNKNKWEKPPGVSSDQVVSEVLNDFIDNSFEIFLFIKKDRTEKANYVFKDNGIPLYVLDPHRFKLAFDIKNYFPDKIDPALINSIMRPTLLKRFLWWVKLP